MGANSMTTELFHKSEELLINLNTIKQPLLLFQVLGGVYLQNGQYVGMIVRGAVKGLI